MKLLLLLSLLLAGCVVPAPTDTKSNVEEVNNMKSRQFHSQTNTVIEIKVYEHQ